MLATLDFVARSDWVAVLPGIMMAIDSGAPPLKVNPLADPPLWLDLVLIEPSRRTMAAAAQSFLSALEAESHRLNRRWEPQPRARDTAREPPGAKRVGRTR
jgi:DNA-binding transcriptional LysR family regulator